MSEHELIARLEADVVAKEQELGRRRSLILSEGSGGPVTLPPQYVPNPEIEAQIRRAEAELIEAQERYEEALNA